VDFKEPDDEACLARIRNLVALLPEERWAWRDHGDGHVAAAEADQVYTLVDPRGRKEYDGRKLIATLVDKGSENEYKADYGKTLITTYAKIGGFPVGIVANQRKRCETAAGEVQIGGVIYADSADKAARFVLDCNHTGIPILFLQDVVGFMVGRDSEQAGVIRSGAKLVNALSNAVVPKITVVVGGSFGAGNYALCGKAYDPRFIFAWTNAQYAVMGAAQASSVIFNINKRTAEARAAASGEALDSDALEVLRKEVHEGYTRKTDIRYGAARGWVDGIIAPHETRETLITCLGLVARERPVSHFKTGVIQT